jgi:Predicted O-methyltransferase
MKTDVVKLSQIKTNTANPRQIKDGKFTKLVNSILVFPKMLSLRPIVVDSMGVALGGNMRYRGLIFIADMSIEDIKAQLSDCRDFHKKTTAEQNALFEYWEHWRDCPTAPVIKAADLSDSEQREFIIKDNVGYGEWDMDILANEWDEEDLDDWGLDVWQDESEEEDDGKSSGEPTHGSLVERFVIPPFSVLDTRKGYWQARKKAWRELIGDLGESRNDTLFKNPETKFKHIYRRTRGHRESLGIGFQEYLDKYVPEDVKEREAAKVLSAGVSLFDPVLSEIMCRWFTHEKGAKIFDCFSGDTQKGLVFAQCSFEFTGIELRQEQVDVNNRVIADRGLPIKYICDDGRNVLKHFEPDSQDMLFSCPPYYNLEVYSDDPSDASNQATYADSLKILESAYADSLKILKNDRFAIIVVGDVRDKKTGLYHNLVDDLKRIFKENGAALYNELILVETAASTALRASRNMDGRKVAKMHQNVLVFYKGNTKNISKTFPKIEFTEDELKMFDSEMNNSEEEES